MKSYRTARKKRRCGHRKLLLVVMLTLTAGGAVAFAGFIKLTLEPNMEELAKIRAEAGVENGDSCPDRTVSKGYLQG